MHDWNSSEYLKFRDERTQPSRDLVSRLGHLTPKRILDVGCGPGNSTDVLAERFGGAYILGIDNSPHMVETAKANYPGCDFRLLDACNALEALDADFDIVFSNACIQWIPNHRELLKNMLGLLKPGGMLAVQTPMAHDVQRHIVITAQSERWALKIPELRLFHNLTPQEYHNLLADIATDFTIWQVTYYHRLKSHIDIIEWFRSTAMAPYLSALEQEDRSEFERDVYERVVKTFKAQANGEVVMKFPRLFFTAVR